MNVEMWKEDFAHFYQFKQNLMSTNLVLGSSHYKMLMEVSLLTEI